MSAASEVSEGSQTLPGTKLTDLSELTASPPPLDEGYYLTNFHLIRTSVLALDAHLFSETELQRLAQFCGLPEPVQRLYVRLFNRTGPLFRLDRLSYAEIPDLPHTARALRVAGFALGYEPDPLPAPELLPVAQALAAYTVPELTLIARGAGLKTATKAGGRAGLLTNLLTLDPAELLACLLQLGPLLRLQHTGLFERLQRLFFLNGMQDASTLVTRDLALIRYPTYRIWRTRPVFETREGLEAWLDAQTLQQQWYDALMTRSWELARPLGEQAVTAFLTLPPGPTDFLERFTARSVHARTALHFAHEAEKSLGREESARLYTRLLDAGLPARMRGEAWCRLALHWERTGWLEGAVAVCRQALEETSTRRGERLELERRLERLVRRLTPRPAPRRRPRESAAERPAPSGLESVLAPTPDTPPPAPTPDTPPLQLREVHVQRPLLASGLYQRIQFAGRQGQAMTVEALALEAYRSRGAEGLHSENGLFTTLCTLLFWDIFFAELPDVFLSPFQDAPLDLNTDHFYEARRELIEGRLHQLRAGDLSGLKTHYRRYEGISARGMAWEAFPLPLLETVTAALGGPRLAGILAHLLEDYRLHRRGFPDLLLWRNPSLPLDFEAEALFWGQEGYSPPGDVWFAEVKSPRDRVSAEQTAWMETLLALGIPVEICRVEEVP